MPKTHKNPSSILNKLPIGYTNILGWLGLSCIALPPCRCLRHVCPKLPLPQELGCPEQTCDSERWSVPLASCPQVLAPGCRRQYTPAQVVPSLPGLLPGLHPCHCGCHPHRPGRLSHSVVTVTPQAWLTHPRGTPSSCQRRGACTWGTFSR